MSKILLIEDDSTIAVMVEDMLLLKRHVVDSIDDGKKAIELLRKNQYDVLIVDWKLPGRSGIEVCQWYRASGGNAKILFLTGRDSIDDKEEGFSAGADDYLPKPFDLRELAMRVDALLRRSDVIKSDVVSVGDISLDRQSTKVVRGDSEIYLTDLEFALLEFFVQNPNRCFTNKMLMEHVWPADSKRSPDTMRIAINKLRKKIDIEGVESVIQNVHGRGYMLKDEQTS